MMEDIIQSEAQPTGAFEEVLTPKLQDRMAKATQHQEQQLDAIYSGVKQLHFAADAANEEVLMQNAMLDETVVHVNETDAAVQQQTKAARKVVHRHRKLGCYYGVIVLLIAALLIVVFV